MIQAYFNQIRKKIIEEINNSNKDIIIAVAWFTQHDLFDAIINAVAHKQFANIDLRSLCVENGVIYDVKGILPKEIIDARL